MVAEYVIPLWPWTLTFWPQNLMHYLCPIIHHWCKFGENPTNTFQDIVLTLTSLESVVSSTLYSRDLDLWPFDPKWSVYLCPIMHHWRKFSKNVSNTLQDIMLTFRDACVHAQTNRTKAVHFRPHYVGWRHKTQIYPSSFSFKARQ